MKKSVLLLIMLIVLFSGCNAPAGSVNTSESLATEATVTGEDASSKIITTVTEQATQEKDYSELLFNAIKTKGEIFRQKYEPFYITDVTISTGYDYNYDGINDYIVIYNTYMQFDMVFFDGVTAEIIREIHQLTMFLENLVTIQFYINDDNDYLFKRYNHYQEYVASDYYYDNVQIEAKDKSKIFEAVYDENDEFLHAYDRYPDEEAYLAAQNTLLEGYHYVVDIEWAGSFDYMDENGLQALSDILNI
jgi:hypothetical protein